MGYMSEIDILIREAAELGVTLTLANFGCSNGGRITIDGEPASEWLTDMRGATGSPIELTDMDRKALAAVLDYVQPDEEADYAEREESGDTGDHILTSIRYLRNRLNTAPDATGSA